MVEASPHEPCNGVSWSCAGNIEILGGLLEQLILADRASGIETQEVWTVNPHANRVALAALHHHFRHTHLLVGIFWQLSGGFIPQPVVACRGNMPNAIVHVHEEYAPSYSHGVSVSEDVGLG